MRHARKALILAVLAFGLGLARPASAQPDHQTEALEEARRLYSEAHGHFIAGRCQEAMPLLLRANRLVPSPNSGLLIARCLVADNKQVEGANRYAEVERDALNLIRAGETRYADTAAAAAKEGAALRAKLGTLRIRLPPRAGVALEIDGDPTEIQSEGETTVLHEPGAAKVTFILPAGRRERPVTIAAGRETVITYEADETPPSPPPPPPPRLPWTFFASSAGAVAGLATFAVFGLASESTYESLDARCAPRCTAADRPEADKGQAFQTVANVGLVVGLVFAVATGAILATR